MVFVIPELQKIPSGTGVAERAMNLDVVGYSKL